MRRPALVLRDGDRDELERRAASRTYGVRDVQRAELILMAADGVSDRDAGRIVGMHYNQVAVWRRRYEDLGLAGWPIRNALVARRFTGMTMCCDWLRR